MKRCISILLILCLLLACPHVLAADEPPAEPETESAGEALPENGEAENPASPEESGEAGEAGEVPSAEEDTGEASEEPSAPGDTPEEPEESGDTPEVPGEEPEDPEEPGEPEDKGYVPGQFTDVDESRWYGVEGQGVIRRVWELGLMNGMGNGTFLPEGPLRLCEAVKLAAVIRSSALEDGAEFPATQPWYQTYVDYAEAEGILQPGEFAGRMGEAVTRGELAHILAAALPEQELAHCNAIFAIPDVISLDTEPVDYWQDILKLYRAGVLLGDGGTHAFRPGDGITRTETAAAVVRMALPEERLRLELLPLTGASLPLPETALSWDDGTALSLGYHPWDEFFAFVGGEWAALAADFWVSLDRDDSLGYPVYGEEGSRIRAEYSGFTVEYLIADRNPRGMYVLLLETSGEELTDNRGIRVGTALRDLLQAFPEAELSRESGDSDTVWYSASPGNSGAVCRYAVGWDGRVTAISMAIREEP